MKRLKRIDSSYAINKRKPYQPERNPAKKGKDARQGHVLLDATRYFLSDSYPMNLAFVLELPPQLRDPFTAWAEPSGFDPTNPSA